MSATSRSVVALGAAAAAAVISVGAAWLGRRQRRASPGLVGPFVGAIDQGTSSSRFIVFDRRGEVVVMEQVELQSSHPQPGWCEQDPAEIMTTVVEAVEGAVAKMRALGLDPAAIEAVGITNQRETTIVWDKTTGAPLCNAIVWLDLRTAKVVADLAGELGSKDALRKTCGLPLATYFSGVKLKWIMENVPKAAEAIREGRALFGTVDSWLIWNLTGATRGGVHVTDVTNASRTMLMNIKTLDWDTKVLKTFKVPKSVLPEIKSSSEVYGRIHSGPLQGTAIAGCLGDQQAALFGQQCLAPGEAKNTYGTGCFLLFNTGEQIVQSKSGLLTTVAYQIGPKAAPVYALEGSIAIAGAAVNWMKNQMGLVASAGELSTLAATVESTGGVYFVPAFSGLYAPYWRDDARGVIVGLTQFTNKKHLCRATLEAVCFQTRELIDAISTDSKVDLQLLKVDGGMTKSSFLLQQQADLLGIPVVQPQLAETTALGAALAAGLATGVWESIDDMRSEVILDATVHGPQLDQAKRDLRFAEWKDAVKRSFGLARE